jgi:sec-independent protein translocase protein TatC
MTATADPLDAGRMTLLEHLAELRTRIIRSALAIAVGAIVCWFLYDWLLEVLTDPYCDITNEDCRLNVFEPLEPLSIRMSIAAYGGVALAVPVWLWQAWQFISPGLYPHERRHGLTFVGLGVALFASGAALAYWSLPRALEFLIDIGGEDLITMFRVREYVMFVVKMMIAFGLGFQFPLLLAFLQIIGIVTPEQLGHYRRYAGIGIVILVAVITPSGDPITLVALSVPMYLFYEGAMVFGRLRRRRQRRRERALDPTSTG